MLKETLNTVDYGVAWAVCVTIDSGTRSNSNEWTGFVEPILCVSATLLSLGTEVREDRTLVLLREGMRQS